MIVWFDMDGVLADFEGGFYKISGTTVDDITDEEMWASIGSYGKAKFFSELEWMAGGKEIWQFALDNFPKVKILSALGRSDKIDKQTTQGKLMWIRHNIPSLQLDDIILVDNKHRKRHYCKPGDIIIDDTPVVIDEWTKKGGIGIFQLIDRVELSELAIEAIGSIAVLDGFAERPGHSSNDGACV